MKLRTENLEEEGERRKEEYENWIKQNEIENLEEEGGRRNMNSEKRKKKLRI
jgi:hypothetical protein